MTEKQVTDVKCECGRYYRDVRALPVHCACGKKAATPGFVYERVLTYVDRRKAICDQCERNVAGVCLALKEITPERPCAIRVGVFIRCAYCPIGLWDKELDPSPT